MRRAAIYKRKKQFFVHGRSRTTDGVWISSEPWVALPETTDDSQLVDAIRGALNCTQIDVPHPKEWKDLEEPLLTLAGVKEWTTFSKGAAYLVIKADGGDGGLTLLPTTNRGAREGFVHETSKQVVLDEHDPQLGATVRSLLTNAKPE